MKKIFVPFCLLLILTACGGNKAQDGGASDSDSIVSTAIDSDSVVTEKIMSEIAPKADKEDPLMAKQVIPASADEYFYDFIGSFCQKSSYQMERIQFPLVVIENGKNMYWTKDQWSFSKLHYNTEAYTVFFPSVKAMDLEKSKTLNNVVIQHINADSSVVDNYNFEKLNGNWMLTSIKRTSIEEDPDNSFVSFYAKCTKNKSFADEHIANEVTFSGTLDDTETGSYKNVKNQSISKAKASEYFSMLFDEYQPEKFSNIDFGQNNASSNTRIVSMEEPSGGFSLTCYFKKENDSWKLFKVESK